MRKRDSLLEELRLSERMLREDGEVVRRFRVATGHGTFILFAPVEATAPLKLQSTRLVRGFMLWYMARWFVVSLQLQEPQAVASFLVARDERLGVMRRIDDGATRLGKQEWLPPSALDSDMADLLPEKSAAMSEKMYQELMSGADANRLEIAGPF